jgi:hypothetical protein
MTFQEIAHEDARRLIEVLSEEAAWREANDLPPMWFERLFGFDVKLWRSISNE